MTSSSYSIPFFDVCILPFWTQHPQASGPPLDFESSFAAIQSNAASCMTFDFAFGITGPHATRMSCVGSNGPKSLKTFLNSPFSRVSWQRVSTTMGTTGHPAFSASFAPIDEYTLRLKTSCRVPCGKMRKLSPPLMRSCPTLSTVIRSSRGDLRLTGTMRMCSAALERNGRCASDAFAT